MQEHALQALLPEPLVELEVAVLVVAQHKVLEVREVHADLVGAPREELGLDPNELGSPWGAAWSSFLAFGAGALVPLIPLLLFTGQVAFIGGLAVSFAALFAVGAGVSLVTGRGMLFSGTRQVLIGAAAAAVTYGVGTLIGAGVAG